MARACLGVLKLLQGTGAASCTSVRHVSYKLRHKYVDPFNVPTLYLGEKLLPPNDPEIKPKTPPNPALRNRNKRWRALVKTRFVNANRKKMVDWAKARKARQIALRVKRWKDNIARLKEWKPEARAVYATKKITAIRGLPELLLERNERPKRLS